MVLNGYNFAFRNFEMGYASALAYVLFFMLVGLWSIQLRLQNGGVHSE